MSSAAALLLLPLLTVAGQGPVCQRPPVAAVILQQASTCRAVDAPGLRGHRAGFVEVGFALSLNFAITLAENLGPVACAARLAFGAREFNVVLVLSTFVI
jgi:hypothetical protein